MTSYLPEQVRIQYRHVHHVHEHGLVPFEEFSCTPVVGGPLIRDVDSDLAVVVVLDDLWYPARRSVCILAITIRYHLFAPVEIGQHLHRRLSIHTRARSPFMVDR